MHKAASRKIGIFLTGLIFLAGAGILNPSLCSAGMHELSDGEMAAVNGAGFSSFTLDSSGLATLNFDGITLSTYTEIQSLKMGYYGGSWWDQDWEDRSVGGTGKNSLGTYSSDNSNDLVFNGLYIKAKFTNVDSSSRQLQYVQIGTNHLSGDISGYFNNLSAGFGSLTGTGVYKNGILQPPYGGGPETFNHDMVSMNSGSSPSLTTITANNTGFNLCLDSTGVGTGNPKGYSFHWDSATIH